MFGPLPYHNPCRRQDKDGIWFDAPFSISGGYEDENGKGGGVLFWAYSLEEAKEILAQIIGKPGYTNLKIVEEPKPQMSLATLHVPTHIDLNQFTNVLCAALSEYVSHRPGDDASEYVNRRYDYLTPEQKIKKAEEVISNRSLAELVRNSIASRQVTMKHEGKV